MNVLIDASNITNGGGLTHIVNLINNFDSKKYPKTTIYISAPKLTLQKFTDKPWLVKENDPMLDSNVFVKLFWRLLILPKKISKLQADVVFSPGGFYIGNLEKVVTMSQNMLIFERNERKRFSFFSWSRFRLKTLYFIQSYIFTRAKGIILISNYAKNYITKQLNISEDYPVIYHGIEKRFFKTPKPQFPISYYSFEKPFKLLYTSIVDVYKHQWILVEACAILRSEGLPIELNLVGGAYPPALKKLKHSIEEHDSKGEFVVYHGKVDFEKIEQIYGNADGFVFASTCENMPNIVVEAMAAGLPVLSSKFGPMPEIVGEDAMLFDPTSVHSSVVALRKFICDAKAREKSSNRLSEKAKTYSWQICADKTFEYIISIGQRR